MIRYSATAALLGALKKSLDIDDMAWRLGLNPNDREDARTLSLQSGLTLEEAMQVVHHEKISKETP